MEGPNQYWGVGITLHPTHFFSWILNRSFCMGLLIGSFGSTQERFSNHLKHNRAKKSEINYFKTSKWNRVSFFLSGIMIVYFPFCVFIYFIFFCVYELGKSEKCTYLHTLERPTRAWREPIWATRIANPSRRYHKGHCARYVMFDLGCNYSVPSIIQRFEVNKASPTKILPLRKSLNTKYIATMQCSVSCSEVRIELVTRKGQVTSSSRGQPPLWFNST